MQDGDASAPDDQRDGNGTEKLDHWIIECVGEDGVSPGGFILGVHGGEVAKGAGLAVEELDHAHS